MCWRSTRFPFFAFLSTPSARRATFKNKYLSDIILISIHALREEGDLRQTKHFCQAGDFYPRPPRGGRRLIEDGMTYVEDISIHALREEGDRWRCINRISFKVISIHALREEGDKISKRQEQNQTDFYPRPPRGGRPPKVYTLHIFHSISIHALREEGDGTRCSRASAQRNFYPRPPRGGRPFPETERQRTHNISIHALREEGDLRQADSVRVN